MSSHGLQWRKAGWRGRKDTAGPTAPLTHRPQGHKLTVSPAELRMFQENSKETLAIVAHGSHLAHLIQKLLGEQTCYKISLELITSHGAWMQGIVCT